MSNFKLTYKIYISKILNGNYASRMFCLFSFSSIDTFYVTANLGPNNN